jgi:hypothetical protein
VRRKLIILAAVVLVGLLPAGSARADSVPLDLEQGGVLHYSGPIGVVNLYWDASWPAFEMDRIDAETQAVLASDYATNLRQYGVPGFVWRGRGTLLPGCLAAPATADQFRIASFVRCEESGGGVPAGGGALLDFSTARMIYNVIVPDGTTLTLFGLSSCPRPPARGFDAFHGFTPSGLRASPLLPPGRPLLFTAIPAHCAATAGYLPLITHELADAATDPIPDVFWINDTNVLGGRLNLGEVLSKGEAADVCSALYSGDNLQARAQEHFRHVPYAGTEVAAYWSNADHACVVGPWRAVWTEFTALGTNPIFLKLGRAPDAVPLPHWEVVLGNTDYQFVAPALLPAGQRYRFYGDCAGTVTFPGTTDAAAARTYQCGGVLQDEVRFEAAGLPVGTGWQVTFDGVAHGGPASKWVDDGTPVTFDFAAVPNCTLTATSFASGSTVTGPTTITATYDCGGAPLPGCSTYPQAVAWTHPTAYWRLDDTGPTAHDSGPFGLDGSYEPGVVQNVPGGILGDFDTAAEFSGSGVVIPSSPPLDITGNAVSIEVWARGGPQSPYAYLVSKSDFHGTLGYSLYAGSNGTLRFFVGNGFSRITDETGFVWDGNWHHIVGVYDGSSLKLYVDNVLLANTPASGSIASSLGTPLAIGRWQGGGFPFSGALDEVAVYDHALTADQVQTHYLVGRANYFCA